MQVVGTKGGDIVLPLKDPTSDMAVIARKGSDLVKKVRCGCWSPGERLRSGE